MNPPVAELLAASAAVTALVGTGPVRIFEDVAPQNTARPYIVWRVVYGTPENYLGQPPGIDYCRVQIDCYGEHAAQAREVALAVRNALQPHATEIGRNPNVADPETGLRSYSFDWGFWTHRESASSS